MKLADFGASKQVCATPPRGFVPLSAATGVGGEPLQRAHRHHRHAVLDGARGHQAAGGRRPEEGRHLERRLHGLGGAAQTCGSRLTLCALRAVVEMATSKPPWSGMDTIQAMWQIANNDAPLPLPASLTEVGAPSLLALARCWPAHARARTHRPEEISCGSALRATPTGGPRRATFCDTCGSTRAHRPSGTKRPPRPSSCRLVWPRRASRKSKLQTGGRQRACACARRRPAVCERVCLR